MPQDVRKRPLARSPQVGNGRGQGLSGRRVGQERAELFGRQAVALAGTGERRGVEAANLGRVGYAVERIGHVAAFRVHAHAAVPGPRHAHRSRRQRERNAHGRAGGGGLGHLFPSGQLSRFGQRIGRGHTGGKRPLSGGLCRHAGDHGKTLPKLADAVHGHAFGHALGESHHTFVAGLADAHTKSERGDGLQNFCSGPGRLHPRAHGDIDRQGG